MYRYSATAIVRYHMPLLDRVIDADTLQSCGQWRQIAKAIRGQVHSDTQKPIRQPRDDTVPETPTSRNAVQE